MPISPTPTVEFLSKQLDNLINEIKFIKTSLSTLRATPTQKVGEFTPNTQLSLTMKVHLSLQEYLKEFPNSYDAGRLIHIDPKNIYKPLKTDFYTTSGSTLKYGNITALTLAVLAREAIILAGRPLSTTEIVQELHSQGVRVGKLGAETTVVHMVLKRRKINSVDDTDVPEDAFTLIRSESGSIKFWPNDGELPNAEA